MKDGRIVIKGAWITRTEYEIRFAKKDDPYCYSAYPCDKDGNLIMKGAEDWGRGFIRSLNSEDYEVPYIAERTTKRKEPDLIECGCGRLYLGVANSYGQIVCPVCNRSFGSHKKALANKPKPDRKGFHIVPKEVAG